jgi:hypothetical protein
LQSAAIGTAYISDGAITNAKIANLAVQTANIGDLNVTTLKIANGAVTASTSASLTSDVYTSMATSAVTIGGYTFYQTGWTTAFTGALTTSGNPVLLIKGFGLAEESYSGSSFNGRNQFSAAYAGATGANAWLWGGSVSQYYLESSGGWWGRCEVRLLINGTTAYQGSDLISLSAGTYSISVQFRYSILTLNNIGSMRGVMTAGSFFYLLEAKK